MKNRWFQWVVGDRRGEVLALDNIIEEDNIVYISFKDGSRINSELVAEINQKSLDGKMMAEVDSPNNIWAFKETIINNDDSRTEVDWETQVKYDVPSITEIASDGKQLPKKTKKIELIPPRPTYNKFGKISNTKDIIDDFDLTNKKEIEIPISDKKIEQTSPNKSTVNSDDPIYIMMEKSKKIVSEITMSLAVLLPSKSLYNVAKESFDDGDIKTIEYIIENIDISKIKESLKEGIKQMYERDDEKNNIQ